MKRIPWLVLLFAGSLAAQSPPDLILYNGKVFTPGGSRPWAEAVAIRGKQIVAVGGTIRVRKMAGDGTIQVDLRKHLVIPGINDAHVHSGTRTESISLSTGPESGSNEVRVAIAAARSEIPPGFWIEGTIGPAVLNDPVMNAAALGRTPVLLTEFTGHGTILSASGLAALDAAAPADPIGGWFERTANGAVTGKAFEYAEYNLFRKFYDRGSDADEVAAVRSLSDQALQYGITTLQVMPWMPARRFVSIVSNANPAVHVRVMRIPVTDATELHVDDNRDPSIPAVKWFLDGTPIERGAALRHPYPNSTAQGKINLTQSQIRTVLDDVVRRNEQPLFHAAGDATIALLLDTMDKMGRSDWPDLHVRIEHGDGLQKDLIPVAKRLGITVVQNPTHLAARRFYPPGDYMLLKRLLAEGIHLAFGSDGALNPYLNIQQAVTHPGNPSEAITVAEAVIAYTEGSAWAEKAVSKGRIAPGQLADLAVLSDDIFIMNPDQLPRTLSIMTVVSGRIAYDAGLLSH